MARRSMLAVFAIVAIVVACSIPSFAQTVKLQYKFSAGSVAKYAMSSGRDAAAYNQDTGGDLRTSSKASTIVVSQTVNSVDANGVANVSVAFDQFAVSGDKELGEATLPLPVKLLIKPNGSSLLYQDSVGQLGTDEPVAASSPVSIALPDEPISVGQSWTTDVALLGDKGTAKLVSTLVGPDMFGDKRAWRIYQEFTAGIEADSTAVVPVNGFRIRGRNYILISADDCSLLKISSTVTTVTVGQNDAGKPKVEKVERTYTMLTKI